VLRRAGIVQSRKEGLWVFYAVDLDALRRAFAAIDADLARRLELSANENPHARLREKVEKGLCCPTSASKFTATL
jgi:DNA-binding transcriptional ArsR family regulator